MFLDILEFKVVHNVHALFATANNWGCFCFKNKPDNHKVSHNFAASIENYCKLVFFVNFLATAGFTLNERIDEVIMLCPKSVFALSASPPQLSITDCTLLLVWFTK